MFELKTNKEIGNYLKKIILSKYESQRKFCIAYLYKLNYSKDISDDEIRRMTNRLSQILKGDKSIQTYDLPIFSELLGISCEQMLSAGAYCTPLTNRKTNYNIAFSKDKHDWEEYVKRDDCIFSYGDEFGKTVVDYALEFKNYGFIKFLIENGYITFVSSNPQFSNIEFIANTKFEVRKYDYSNTLENELFENKILRTQIISLALENNDYNVLDTMKAREIPTQSQITIYNLNVDYDFDSYYDNNFIDTILSSNKKVIDYFCEDYEVESFGGAIGFWLFPFMDCLVERAVEIHNKYTDELLNTCITHNKVIFQKLKDAVLLAAKSLKKGFLSNTSFKEIINEHVLRDFHISNDRRIISYYSHWQRDNGVQSILSNIIHTEINSKNPEVQKKIDELNDSYSQIINLKDHIIKN